MERGVEVGVEYEHPAVERRLHFLRLVSARRARSKRGRSQQKDRKRVVSGTSVAESVDLGGRRIINKTQANHAFVANVGTVPLTEPPIKHVFPPGITSIA